MLSKFKQVESSFYRGQHIMEGALNKKLKITDGTKGWWLRQ